MFVLRVLTEEGCLKPPKIFLVDMAVSRNDVIRHLCTLFGLLVATEVKGSQRQWPPSNFVAYRHRCFGCLFQSGLRNIFRLDNCLELGNLLAG